MRERRGISAIVATVMTILITIAAISIVWVFVLPFFNETSFIEEEDVHVSIIISKGYTVYDKDKEFGFVQIKRGEDNVVVDKLNFIFDIEGNSVTYETDEVLGINAERVYSFNFSRDGIEGVPAFVSVVPIFIRGSGEVVGAVTSKIKMPVKFAVVDVEDDQLSKKNTVKGGGGFVEYDEFETILLSDCVDGFLESGKRYILQQDVVAESFCFYLIGIENTILDLNNHKITGSAGYPAVYVEGSNNLLISNGEINGAWVGIYMLANSVMNNISNVKVLESTDAGLYMDSTSGSNRIVSSEFSDARGVLEAFGILSWSGNNYLENVQANGNSVTGVDAGSVGIFLLSSSGNYLENVQANGNYVEGVDGLATGIRLFGVTESTFVNVSTSDNYCVNNCQAYTKNGGSTAIGLGVALSYENSFIGIDAKNNFHSGVYLYQDNYDNVFDGGNFSNNGNFGLTLQNSWNNNFSNIFMNDMKRGAFIVSVDDMINDNNVFENVTALRNDYGFYFEKISSTVNVTNMKIVNSTVCNSGVYDISCDVAATGMSGSDNIFGDNIDACVDNSWPELDVDYTDTC